MDRSARSPVPEFHPLITRWFTRRYGSPTGVQERVWPAAARGEHILMTAPTGSGKTLAAFLWALNRLFTGAWPTGALRILYVSPLKALNNDIQRNLREPLEGIREAFRAAGEESPDIRVMTRSGDTGQYERRSMVLKPPEILITTPESLNLLLSSPAARRIFDTLQLVILDEIHAVASSKRGTHLISAVERLTLLAGEFQRIALSATVKPLETLGAFIGGYRFRRDGRPGMGEQRKVTLIDETGGKKYDIRTVFPEKVEVSVWPSVISSLADTIRANRSTLIFTNSRRTAEKIARLLNEHFGETKVYAHHGSLSRELRNVVEEKMKKGELAGIVATSSLELGIDIGSLDTVVCVQTPFTISGALQRAGRSGHAVGEQSRMTFYPLHGMDILFSAAMTGAVMEGDIEESRVPRNTLDVLAQVILSMTALESWEIDHLYSFLRCCYPWHDLPRSSFDGVLDMLSGRFADTKIHELQSRIILDREAGTVEGRRGNLPLLNSSGGTIPDRGYFQLRLAGSGALIGELDEEFVWERKLKDLFTLGNRTWRITGIDDRSVEVTPVSAREAMTPFWRAEARGRSFLFCRRVLWLLDRWNDESDKEAFFHSLRENDCLDEGAAAELCDLLSRQTSAFGGILPGTNRLVLEYPAESLTEDRKPTVIHTFWGWEVNAPFALALSGAAEQRFGGPVQTYYSDTSVLLEGPAYITPQDLINLLPPERVPELLRKKLEDTGLFGAEFRENASRSLLLPRSTGRKRMPLWLSRLKGKKLFQAVSRYPDFPILLETWRSCLDDTFDLPSLLSRLEALADGSLSTEALTTAGPSPFAAEVFFQRTGEVMYADDRPEGGKPSRLRDDYILDLLGSDKLRPKIPRTVIAAFERRLQRTENLYAPKDEAELLDWLRQRRFLTAGEWNALLEAAERDGGTLKETWRRNLEDRIRRFTFPGSKEALVALPGEAKRLASGKGAFDPGRLMAEWLSWYGPVAPERVSLIFGLKEEEVRNILDGLTEEGEVIQGLLSEDADTSQICSVRSMEILLRMKRKMARPDTAPLSPEQLAPFLAAWSGVPGEKKPPNLYEKTLEALLLYPAEASLWEEDLLPARIPGYDGRRLDTLMAESGLLWVGHGQKRIFFTFPEDLKLSSGGEKQESLEDLFPHGKGIFHYWDLKDYSHLDSGTLSRRLWDLAWKGLVTSPGLETLRQAIENGFSAPPADQPPGRRPGRGTFHRWERARQVESLWEPLRETEEPEDLMDEEERTRERIRLLLGRYGVLSPPLLARELPAFRWNRLFASLRLMEFSGEVVGGLFFQGLPGPQFASPEAVMLLEDFAPPEVTWWINAADPASLCGTSVDEYPHPLPRRLSSNHLVYRGSRLVMTSLKKGRELIFHLPPEDPLCAEGRSLFDALLGRAARPVASIKTVSVNGIPVDESPYRPVLEELGFRRGYGGYVLRKI
ncbi:MAG: DEAD/DEAH box helicase [Spirochaetales bacterium]|nr:DEAD/DEAH box helicase [Spirochaetales bacterium]